MAAQSEKQTVKLSFDFPKEEHRYLKMTCAKIGMSIKDFIEKATKSMILEYEDDFLAEKTSKELNENDNDFISTEQLKKELNIGL